MEDNTTPDATGSNPNSRLSELLERLKSSNGLSLGEGLGENNSSDAGLEVIALITSAVHDARPAYTLSQIRSAVAQSGSAAFLDPLHIVPLLVNCRDESASEILALVGECGNAKEVVIAVQEAVERIARNAQLQDEEDEDNEMDAIPSTPFQQLDVLIPLYVSAVPRIKLRTKGAGSTMRSFIPELEEAIVDASPSFSPSEGRIVIQKVTQLVSRLCDWANDQPGGVESEQQIARETLRSLLIVTVGSLANCIGADLAQRGFEMSYPRFAFRSAVRADWTEGEALISEATVVISSKLNCTPNNLLEEKTVGALVLFAHSKQTTSTPHHVLAGSLPVIVASIQTHSGLDESLYILFTSLKSLEDAHELLDPEISTPLSAVLAPLACLHPSPPIRFLVFRTLALVLAVSPPLHRLHLLRDLLSDGDPQFPQMRVAAVGLLKEAILEALSSDVSPGGGQDANPFASPLLLESVGSIIFRPDPRDLFSTLNDVKDVLENPELRRLAECLSLYYVLLCRDEKNKTGIHDGDCIRSIEGNLLSPLKDALRRWTADAGNQSESHNITILSLLQMALDRVYEALRDHRRQ